MLERVHHGFVSAGFGEAAVRFTLTDHAPIPNAANLAEIKGFRRVSAISRVLKRLPILEEFAQRDPRAPAEDAPVRALSNLSPSGTVLPVPFATLLEIARGVPKSFPFRTALFHFSAPGFPTDRRCRRFRTDARSEC